MDVIFWDFCLLTALAFLLVGCAKDLPYTFSIDPSGSTRGCAVSLAEVVKGVVIKLNMEGKSSVAGNWTIKSVQEEFERILGERVEALYRAPQSQCPTFAGQPVEPVEDVSSKWLVTYAFEPADPDHSLERFIEFLLSVRVVRLALEPEVKADVNVKQQYDPWFERSKDKRAQWFGEREPAEDSPLRVTVSEAMRHVAPEASQKLFPRFFQDKGGATQECRDCSLYKISPSRNDLYPGGDPSDPSQPGVLLELAKNIIAAKDRTRRIVTLGYQIPWDEDQTLIRYGVTFYFEDRSEVAQGHHHVTRFLGYDLVYANEATPAPYPERSGSAGTPGEIPQKTDRAVPGYKRAWYATSYPFSLAIGIKNAAFEVAKTPFSFVAGALFGRDSALHYPLQNLRTASDAIQYEATTEPRVGMFLSMYRLFTEIPLVGHLFQYNFGADGIQPSDTSLRRRKIFLSRGIYGGNKWGQDTGLWAAFARWAYPEYDVYSPPYRHGTVTDVVWSMFNLSHGPAYSEALYIKDYAGTADRLYLAGHSGGVQRSAAASRILWYHGYSVEKVMGIAGPSVGQAFVDVRYPDAFRVYLNSQTGADQDVVSQVGAAARAYSSAIGFALRVPFLYVPKILCPEVLIENCSARISAKMEQVGPSNAKVFEVERKPSSLHNTPLRQSLTERVLFDAYIRSEFATAFRDDLERPDVPDGERGRAHAFPWEP